MANDGGLSRIQQRLNAIPKKIREAATAATRMAADDVAGDMKHLAQASKNTGALIDSITVTGSGETTPPYSQPGGSAVVPEGASRITVGNKDVRYPHLVEYGTTKAPAQSFFWPAVRSNQKKVQNTISRAVRKAIKDGWGQK